MKRAQLLVALAVLGCLAAGSASWVFGQRAGTGPVPSVPVPLPTPPGQVEVPLPPAEPAPPGLLLPLHADAIELPEVPPASTPVATPPAESSFPLPVPSMLPPAQPVLQTSASHVVVPTPPGQAVMSEKATTPAAVPQLEPVPASQGPSANADNSTSRQEPAVSLEWSGPATAPLNQPTSYQIVAKNICNTPVKGVIVRYRVPAGVRITSSAPRGQSEGDVLTWDLGTLVPAQEKHIEMQMLPEAKAVISCQASVTFTALSTFRVQVREPKLVLKATVAERVVLGDVTTVSLTVSNPGDGSADHVKIKASVPEGLEQSRGKSFELDLGNLAPGENRTVQLVCLARMAGPQQIECVAVADANLTARDTGKVIVVHPRLDVAVTGPKLRYLARHATFNLKVTNPGTAPASNVSVVHQLPQGFKLHAASGGGRHDTAAQTVTWFIGDLTPSESREVSLEVIPVDAGEFLQKTVATGGRGLRSECEITTRVEGLSALLMELIDSEDPVEVGADTTYDVRVTNTGSKTETNLELVCTVPDKMEFAAAKCAAGCKFRVEGRDVVFEPLPQLSPRADVIYRIMVRGVAPGDLRFRARIRADGLSEPVLREESTRVYGDEMPSHKE